jgi:hypothetical protein
MARRAKSGPFFFDEAGSRSPRMFGAKKAASCLRRMWSRLSHCRPNGPVVVAPGGQFSAVKKSYLAHSNFQWPDCCDRGGRMPTQEDTIMGATTTPFTLATFLLTGMFSPSFAQPAQPAPAQTAPAQPAPGQAAPSRGGPCAQITAACQQAGFVRNGAKSGDGILVDCIRPIMAGLPLQGTKTLPPMDPQVVAACKQQNPNFGMGRTPSSQVDDRWPRREY